MSQHLQRFVDRVRGAEARGVRDLTMSMDDARDLHADLTRLLLELNELRTKQSQVEQEQVITVQMDGGKF
jgi:hypothetical protein